MYKLKEQVWNLTWKIKRWENSLVLKKDAGESHVITVIAMCVIGVALVLVLSGVLKPMISAMCATMQEKISSMFTGL